MSDDKKDPENKKGKEEQPPVRFNEAPQPGQNSAGVFVYSDLEPNKLDPINKKIIEAPQKLVFFPNGDISWSGFKNIDEVIGFIYRSFGHNPQELMTKLVETSKRVIAAEQQRFQQEQAKPKDPSGTPPQTGGEGFGGLMQ